MNTGTGRFSRFIRTFLEAASPAAETTGEEDNGSKYVSFKAFSAAMASLWDMIKNLVSGKQDKLVSGTNIKTINGQAVLGNGDISISGGSSGKFFAFMMTPPDSDVIVLVDGVDNDVNMTDEGIDMYKKMAAGMEGDIDIIPSYLVASEAGKPPYTIYAMTSVKQLHNEALDKEQIVLEFGDGYSIHINIADRGCYYRYENPSAERSKDIFIITSEDNKTVKSVTKNGTATTVAEVMNALKKNLDNSEILYSSPSTSSGSTQYSARLLQFYADDKTCIMNFMSEIDKSMTEKKIVGISRNGIEKWTITL